MSNFVYNDEFETITGTIDGSDFDGHFKALEIAIASKANLAGPQTLSGTHTVVNLVVSGTTDINGGTWA